MPGAQGGAPKKEMQFLEALLARCLKLCDALYQTCYEEQHLQKLNAVLTHLTTLESLPPEASLLVEPFGSGLAADAQEVVNILFRKKPLPQVTAEVACQPAAPASLPNMLLVEAQRSALGQARAARRKRLQKQQEQQTAAAKRIPIAGWYKRHL